MPEALPALAAAATAWLHAIQPWFMLLLPVAIVVGGVIGLLHSQRRLHQAETQLRLHWNVWLMQNFGLPFDGAQPPNAAFVSTLKSHRVLRQQVSIYPPAGSRYQSAPGSSFGYVLRANVLLQDEQRQHWLILLESVLKSGQLGDAGAVQLLHPPAVIAITELRARRALFNDPAAYRQAFGEAPSRAALNAWRKRHPEQDPEA